MNKRGSAIDVIVFIIITFVIVMFFGIWIYGMNLINTQLSSIDTIIGINTTIGSISDDTFGQMNSGIGTLRILSFALVIGMVITIFLTNFFARGNPAFIFVHIGITILAVVLGAYISNAYQDFLANPLFGSTLTSFTATNFILLYLPYFAAVVGIVGSIFLFINPRDPSGGVL